jgi:tetratricopeptide (TPR) repeat protein/transcriptional regulator with XRE-family HTH domain
MSEEHRDRITLGDMIGFLRWLRGGWTQARLSRKTGIDESQLSRYEAGIEPKAPNLRLILAAFDVSFHTLEYIRWTLRLVRGLVKTGDRLALPERDASSQALARLELALLGSAPSDEDHRRVDSLWQWLKGLPSPRRRFFIRETQAFGEWLLGLRICNASEDAAADDADEAIELAELALFTVEHTDVPEGVKTRMKGFGTGFLANAHRVGTSLPVAEATFSRAWKLWREGEDPQGLLSEAYLLDLEASLRRAQRNFEQAIQLHERAIEAARPDEVGHFFLNLSATFEQKGDQEAALRTLARAAEKIDGERHPRLRFGLRFNTAATLCRLGRFQEAEPIVPEVRKLAERQGGGAIDRLKTRWLEANLAAGLGRRDEALSGLDEVRQGFEKDELAYDYALASLDAALLYREEDRFAEIKILADEILVIFKAQNVHREALAAVILLVEAAEKEQITPDLLRRLQDYLAKAKGNPELRFEGL